jgi:FkbM family methyltransferase
MKSRFRKFASGFRSHPLQTVIKAIYYSWVEISAALDDFTFAIVRPILQNLSPRLSSRIKDSIRSTVSLDYPRLQIRIHADSELSLRRSRACAKEPETVDWIERTIREDDVFYDIGANVGAYSLIAAAYLRGCTEVYAFEPSFSTYAQLCRNAILNGFQRSIHPYLIALTDATQPIDFEYRSLDAGAAEHHMSNQVQPGTSDFEPVYCQTILGFRIDDLVANYGFPAPNLMKIDVDGAEHNVLVGAKNTLRHACLRSLLVEVRRQGGHMEEIVRMLEDADFGIQSMHDRGDGIIWNYIFTRNSTPAERHDR